MTSENTDIIQRENTDLSQVNHTPSVQQSANPAKLLEVAIQNDLDMDKLERLMAMQERWEAKNAQRAFFDALAGFQAECPVIKKTSQVDYTTAKGRTFYTFAPLDQIVRQTKEPLARWGLSYRFNQEESSNGVIVVTCILTHRDGHSETCTLSGVSDQSGGKNNIQAKSSTTSYLRRNTLSGVLGLATTDSDDDGVGASKWISNQQQQQQQVNAEPAPITESTEADLHAMLQERGTAKETYLPWIGDQVKRKINGLGDLTEAEGRAFIRKLEQAKQ